MSSRSSLPVAVIGAGPVGLAAAAHLASRGLQPLVFEAGSEVGASIREWGHVRLLSPWEYNVDPVVEAMLLDAGWSAPDPMGYPTGDEIVSWYLKPLARLEPIAAALHLNARVEAVTKHGLDTLKDAGRGEAPFELIVDENGAEQRYLAQAVVDASGTWTRPNPLGAGGVPAAGEGNHADPDRLRDPRRARRRP